VAGCLGKLAMDRIAIRQNTELYLVEADSAGGFRQTGGRDRKSSGDFAAIRGKAH